MNKKAKTIMTVTGVGTMLGATAFAISAYNSRPMKTKRMVKRATRAMGNVGGMLTAMAQLNQ